LMAALVAGLAPALQASKSDVVAALKDESQGPSDRLRLRQLFVVAQVAMSILLVVGAAQFVRALQKAGSIELGFDSHGVELTSGISDSPATRVRPARCSRPNSSIGSGDCPAFRRPRSPRRAIRSATDGGGDS